MIKTVLWHPVFNFLNIKRTWLLLTFVFSVCYYGYAGIDLREKVDLGGNILCEVDPPYLCSDFIDTSYIELTIENCDNQVSICIDEAIASMLSYSITDNGQTYNGGVSPCDFDTSFAYTYSSIPGGGISGPYFLDAWDVDGNIYSGTVADMSALTDSMNVWDNGGGWIHDSPTATIRGGNAMVNYGTMLITQISSGNQGTIVRNTTLNPHGSQITLDTGYHELIFTEPIENCTDTLVVLIHCIPCKELYTGALTFELPDCNENQSICFDVSADSLPDYTLSENGLGYVGIVNPCSTDSFFRYDYSVLPDGGTFGPYLLQNWTVNGTLYLGGFNTVGDLVDSMNVWDSGANWDISDPQQTITGGNPQNTYSDIQVVQILTNISGTAPVEQLESVSSIEVLLDTGFHEIVFYNNKNQCTDTFDLEINCTPCQEYPGDTMIDIMASHCDSSAGVCLPVPFLEIDNYTVIVNGTAYSNGYEWCAAGDTEMRFDTGTYQLVLTHNITGCIDSVDLVVACSPPVICTDFINETFTALQINDCNSTAELCVEIPFDIITDYNITDNNILFGGNASDCGTGTSLGLSPGFHELIFTQDSTGCSDTISSLVACLIQENLETSLMVLESDTICLDTTELMGDIVSVNNFCEESSGELSLITYDTMTNCLFVEGIEEGTEQVCMEICDTYGFCDTTIINIEVSPLIIIEPEIPPIANDDFVQTEEGTTVNIEILANDQINGTLNSFGILESPQNGSAMIRNDYIIEYTPNPDFCTPTMPDSFSYVLCNEIDCAQAWVYVEVVCKKIVVHNGFSPNGDGINEYFVINGAATNPDNTLSVFNRWGGRVFFEKGYQNTWNGTWDGLDLPDGTYIYHFDNGKGSTATGYVLIQR